MSLVSWLKRRLGLEMYLPEYSGFIRYRKAKGPFMQEDSVQFFRGVYHGNGLEMVDTPQWISVREYPRLKEYCYTEHEYKVARLVGKPTKYPDRPFTVVM